MNYRPKLNISDGAWYAARPIPGTDMWTGEVQCRSMEAAEEACRELNRAAERAQREADELNVLLGKREKTKGKNDGQEKGQ